MRQNPMGCVGPSRHLYAGRSGNGHVVPVVVDGADKGRRWGENDDQPSA